jgi:hypothetical protein
MQFLLDLVLVYIGRCRRIVLFIIPGVCIDFGIVSSVQRIRIQSDSLTRTEKISI